jgi:ribosomal protein L11
MPPAEVVESLEVVEDREFGFVPGVEPATGLLVKELALQRREHTLRERVIDAVRDAAHRGNSAKATQLSLELVRGVFAAAVAVVDDAGDLPAAAMHGHGDRVDDQIGLTV